MKMIFLGSGGAFTVSNYHSNMLLLHQERGLLIDCGGDIRRSLNEAGFDASIVDAVYVSHLHSDHIGGMEWLAFARFFGGLPRPRLLVPMRHSAPLRRILTPGLTEMCDRTVDVEHFFCIEAVMSSFEWQGLRFWLKENRHVGAHFSYGLLFGPEQSVYISTDCNDHGFIARRHLIEQSMLVFHDCETQSRPSGIHTRYETLKQLSENQRSHIWLYHHSDGNLPDAQADGFAGFVQKGQYFDLPPIEPT